MFIFKGITKIFQFTPEHKELINTIKIDKQWEKSYTPDNYISICCICKNQAHLLPEWIKYHNTLGITKIHIFDMQSTDNTAEVLKPYINNKIVIYTKWESEFPGEREKIYNHCINLQKYQTKWLTFLDTEEYIEPLQHNNLIEFLKEYEDFPAIGINTNSQHQNEIKKENNIKFILNPRRVIYIKGNTPKF